MRAGSACDCAPRRGRSRRTLPRACSGPLCSGDGRADFRGGHRRLQRRDPAGPARRRDGDWISSRRPSFGRPRRQLGLHPAFQLRQSAAHHGRRPGHLHRSGNRTDLLADGSPRRNDTDPAPGHERRRRRDMVPVSSTPHPARSLAALFREASEESQEQDARLSERSLRLSGELPADVPGIVRRRHVFRTRRGDSGAA